MKKYNSAIIFVALLVLSVTNLNSFLLVAKGDSAANSVIIVPDDYPSIQSAIDAAEENSTIIVKEGKYEGNILINKQVKIFGKGNSSVIVGKGGYHIIEINKASNVVFAGFAIKGNKEDVWAGIHITQSSNISILNVSVTNCYRGIYIWDSVYCTLRNVVMVENKYSFEVWGVPLFHFIHDIDMSNKIDGRPICYIVNKRNLKVSTNAGYVAVINSSEIRIENLDVKNNGQGLLLAFSRNCSVKDSVFSHNLFGIHSVTSSNLTISNNNFSGNENYGLLAISSPNNRVSHNSFKENKVAIALSYSIYARNKRRTSPARSNRNMIEYNTFENNTFGLMLLSSNNNSILRNIITKNVYGVKLENSVGNLFSGNNFLENEFQVSADLSRNLWDSGYPLGGNHWSGYHGKDRWKGEFQNETGGDMIGDSAYVINEFNVDRYPLIPPKIRIIFDPAELKVNERIELKGVLVNSTDKIILWEWNIDGAACRGQNVTYVFKRTGIHNISLLVTDYRGVISTASVAVTMKETGEWTFRFAIATAILLTAISLSFFIWKKVQKR